MSASSSQERFRHELKIILPLEKVEPLKADLLPWCDFDSHAGPLGCYELGSLYYDTEDLRFFWDREESVAYRRKVRVRSYNQGGEATTLFVEIKEKHRHLCAKKRLILPDTSLLSVTDRHDRLPIEAVIDAMPKSPERSEVEFLHARLRLTPVIIVRYVRIPLIPKFDPDVRITIDTRITGGGENLAQYDCNKEKYVLSPFRTILEVKTNKDIPLWLQSVLRRHELSQSKYSKYCEAVRTYWEPKHYFVPVADSFSSPIVADAPKKLAVGDS